jgi:phage terminase large subunit GpA-like protein
MVDELKPTLYDFLRIENPGPGFCHFPKSERYGEKYFKGLVCETRKTKMVNGRPKLSWVAAPGARNEPLDCRNYAYVARMAYPVALELRARAVGLLPQLEAGAPVMPMKKRRGSPGL